MFMYKKILSFFLDLLFPQNCLSCGKGHDWVCQSCWGSLGLSLKEQSSLPTEKTVEYCDRILVVTAHEHLLLLDILHGLKYRYITELSQYLSDLGIDFFKTFEREKFDFVVPVPLSKKRKLQRGFNQSELLARAISQEFGWALDTQTLIRWRHTRPQVGLNAAERWQNVQGIFSLTNQEKFKNKTILLVDDVVTTGATMRECAKLLKQSGAKAVFGFVILNS